MNFDKYKKYSEDAFLLSSGAQSNVYYDVKEAMGEPENLRQIVSELDRTHKTNLKNIDVIIGIEYGGIPLAVGLSLYTNIPYAILRKSVHEHGTKRRLEGCQKIGRALLLDDVKTSGGSVSKAKEYLKSLGYEIISADVAFDRSKF